jgi:hypothetical protein
MLLTDRPTDIACYWHLSIGFSTLARLLRTMWRFVWHKHYFTLDYSCNTASLCVATAAAAAAASFFSLRYHSNASLYCIENNNLPAAWQANSKVGSSISDCSLIERRFTVFCDHNFGKRKYYYIGFL